MALQADDANRSEESSVGAALDHKLPDEFGFLLDHDRWLQILRAAERPVGVVTIGPYRDLLPIGRGGQGLVYRAYDPRTRRVVALKRMSAGSFATPEATARFQREIETSSALAHPNIVTVYGSEQIDDQLVLSLRWVEGVAFDEWAAARRTDSKGVAEIVRAFLIVCDAVQHAHQRGVIHRDLKPSNILVDAAGQPHILDFGLAGLLDAESVADRLTRTGTALGTPAFAPPEQLRGSVLPDVRSDVYSLGAVLYLNLTGAYPYLFDCAPNELAKVIEHRGPEPPEKRNPVIGRELAAIVMKAMRADPRERYATVDALREDLLRWERGERVLAHPPNAWYLIVKSIHRNRAVIAVSGFIAIILSATAATTTYLYLEAKTQRRAAESALKTSDRDRFVARGTVQFLTEMLRSANRGQDAGASGLTVRAYLDRTGTHLLERPPQIGGPERAGLHFIVAEAYRELGLDRAAVPHLLAALDLRIAEHGPDAYEVAQVHDTLGRAYRQLNELENAERHIEEAWRIHVRLSEESHFLAPTANSLGLVKRSLMKYDEAEHWYREAIRRYRTYFGPDSDQLPVLHNNLGALFGWQGRHADAETMYREALRLSREIHGDRLHLDTLIAQSALGDLVSRRDPYHEEIDAWFDEAHAGMLSLLGPEHPRFGALCERYAVHLARTDRSEPALRLLRDACAAFVASEHWIEFLAVAAREAELLGNLNRAEEGHAALADKLILAEPRITAGNTVPAQAYLVLGRLAQQIGRLADSEIALVRAMHLFEQLGDSGYEGFGQAQAALAAVQEEIAKLEEAPDTERKDQP